MLPPIQARHRTANSFAYDTLRQAILTATIAPGTRLTEQELAEWLEVSRTPIREALRQLEIEGLVEVIPYRGAMVKTLDAEDAREEYTLRAALEGFAAEQAVQHISDEAIGELEGMAQQMDRLLHDGAIQAFLDLNHDFHLKLYRFCGSPRLVAMIEDSWQKDNLYRQFFYAQVEGPDVENAIHRELIKACRNRDAERAYRIMRDSCLQAGELIAGLIKQQTGTGE